MIVSENEKVLIMTRRRFDGDLLRHFVGLVEESAGGLIRATGYAFNFDRATGEFVRRTDMRTRLFGIGDAGLIINVLPATVERDNLRYQTDQKGVRNLTDGQGFEMNISEFGAYR